MLKKFNFVNLIPFVLGASAVAIIIACGNGEIIKLDVDKIEQSRDNLGNLIDYMYDGSSSSIGSSSSGGNSSSSGVGSSSSDGYSSSSGISSSSSGGGSSSSSSSSEVPAPIPNELTCPSTSSAVIGAACTWMPSTVVSGDIARVSTSPAEGCESKVFAIATGSLGRTGTAYFEEGDIVIAGEKPTDNANVKFTWPASGKEERIQSKLTCGETCSVVNCPLTITGAPAPAVTGDLACPAWDLTGNPGKLAIGTDISAGCGISGIAISNNAQAQCGDIELEQEGSTSGTGKVTFKAVATCRNTKHTLKIKEYEVVPDPKLGECTWNKNRLAVGAEAKPTATLDNSYGRCEAVSYTGGFPRILQLSDVGNITGIKASANCGSPVGILESICGTLEVIEFENSLDMNGKTLISVEQGKSYTLTTGCTGSTNFFAIMCGWNSASEGCSVKIGGTTYSGGHNNSPGCRIPAPAVGSVIEIIKANPMQVKCEDQYNGSLCSSN